MVIKLIEIDKKNVFITFVVALLVSAGVSVSDNTVQEPIKILNELDNYFCCVVNNEMIGEPMEFKGGISMSTGYSGYPFEGSRKGAVYCKSNDIKGKWLTIIKTADLFGVDKYDLMPPKTIEPVKEEQIAKEHTQSKSKKEICKIDGKCYPVD